MPRQQGVPVGEHPGISAVVGGGVIDYNRPRIRRWTGLVNVLTGRSTMRTNALWHQPLIALLDHLWWIRRSNGMHPFRIPLFNFPDVVLHAEEAGVKRHTMLTH